MIVKIMQVSDTNNTEELELGEYEITSIQDLAGRVNAEIRGNQLICEWGNGKGEDVFEFEILVEDDMDEASQEFQRIASSTEGYQGSSYKSSNGYEFVIWIDDGDDHPQPESELIQWSVDLDDDTYDDMYKFSMTLPYVES